MSALKALRLYHLLHGGAVAVPENSQPTHKAQRGKNARAYACDRMRSSFATDRAEQHVHVDRTDPDSGDTARPKTRKRDHIADVQAREHVHGNSTQAEANDTRVRM